MRSRKSTTLVVLILAAILFFPTSVQAISLSASEQAWMDENISDIHFAPIKDYPPFLWSQYGAFFGISHDYLNYIQEKLSVNFPKREPRTRSEIVEAMKSGERSFVASMTDTPDRLDYLLFTRSYISVPTIYIGKSGAKVKTGQEIVEDGLKVSVGNDYGIHDYLKDRYPDMLLVPVENNYMVLQNIINGVTEMGALNVATLIHLSHEHNITNLKKLGDTGFKVDLSFAVPASMPELRNILDNVIESMPAKTREAIISRWITDLTAIKALTPGALDIAPDYPDTNENLLIITSALLLMCIGFIFHYIFVRVTPRKDPGGKVEYLP